jgi:predicted RNA-binding Zn-ribbon protein involved in translation (DUF1610 family)
MNKGLIVGISVVVIVVAAGIIMSRGSGSGDAPTGVRDMPVSLIDRNSLEVITKKNSEWQSLGKDATGAVKNPNTNEYTMVSISTCPHCGEQIPTLLPPAPTGDDDADEQAYDQLLKEYKCPKCDKLVTGK